MNDITPDYGPRARIGIATPQANPTVEPEMRALMPPSIGVYATRLVHAAPDVETRLDHYIRHLPAAIASFGVLNIATFGFGCTGSSYRAGATLEDQLTAEASAATRLPVITAAQAIRAALRHLGATRIALVSPYPEALANAGVAYWESTGIRVYESLRVDPALTDTHRIYELTSHDALQAAQTLSKRDIDCIVLSGTGMPTLAALAQLHRTETVPVISSNACLAWCLLRAIAPELAPETPSGFFR
jgi:maleate isomerase